MFTGIEILVVGSGEFAHRITAGLRAGGRAARRVDDLDHAGPRLPSLPTLILADPQADANAFLDALCRIRMRRRGPRRPLRLILIRSSGSPGIAPSAPKGALLTIETFDPEVQAARFLLARWPPHTGMDPPYGQAVHVLIAGQAAPAQTLLIQTLRLAHYGGGASPVITLARHDPQAARRALLAACPQAGRFSRLRFMDIDEMDLEGTPPVTGAFVCLRPPRAGLEIARRLATGIERVQGASPPIVLDVGDGRPAGGLEEWDGQIFPFSWPSDLFRPEILLDGRGDELARVVHAHYRDSIAAQGRNPDREPAGRPWESLEASYRDASRHQADQLNVKLSVLDCRAVPEERVETFSFAPLEAENLAAIEHQRWAAERYLDGWTYAPERDNARKHHPQLIPYADLSEPMKDLDRFAVRLMPTLLARSGRALVRTLLVALIEAAGTCRPGRRLRKLADEALERLAERYPDRGLVVASTLEGEASRLLVRRALDGFEAGLFLLCPRPISRTLAAQAGERQRRDLLELAARAERRIILPGDGEPRTWYRRRPEIGLLLGGTTRSDVPAKQVRIDPDADRLEWTFEY